MERKIGSAAVDDQGQHRGPLRVIVAPDGQILSYPSYVFHTCSAMYSQHLLYRDPVKLGGGGAVRAS